MGDKNIISHYHLRNLWPNREIINSKQPKLKVQSLKHAITFHFAG
jgi:hypothetical protein